jgi:hypothetical protein
MDALTSICIPRSLEVVGEDLFNLAAIETCTFKPESCLQVIPDHCFGGGSLESICIARMVFSVSDDQNPHI